MYACQLIYEDDFIIFVLMFKGEDKCFNNFDNCDFSIQYRL